HHSQNRGKHNANKRSHTPFLAVATDNTTPNPRSPRLQELCAPCHIEKSRGEGRRPESPVVAEWGRFLDELR
ncbi:MAG: hypothetical protein OXG37_04600, partial [Actinomycetia bacterium]|nr:hypothetical protein [Actinomycetes bacterium]